MHLLVKLKLPHVMTWLEYGCWINTWPLVLPGLQQQRHLLLTCRETFEYLSNSRHNISIYKYNSLAYLLMYQPNKPYLSWQLNCRSLRCSWNIACRRCSNYIFILDLIHGINRLGKYNMLDGTRITYVLEFGAAYIRDFTVCSHSMNSIWHSNNSILLQCLCNNNRNGTLRYPHPLLIDIISLLLLIAIDETLHFKIWWQVCYIHPLIYHMVSLAVSHLLRTA